MQNLNDRSRRNKRMIVYRMKVEGHVTCMGGKDFKREGGGDPLTGFIYTSNLARSLQVASYARQNQSIYVVIAISAGNGRFQEESLRMRRLLST